MEIQDIINVLNPYDANTFDIKYEKKRIKELKLSNIYSLRSNNLDFIVKITQNIFKVPITLVSIIDNDIQWFKSSVGVDFNQTPRSLSFCTFTIKSDSIMCIPNALNDDRFKDNKFVIGEPYIRFYAGIPIHSNNIRIGTLCIIDFKERYINETDKDLLLNLGHNIDNEISLHNTNKKLHYIKNELEKEKDFYKSFISSVNHDIKNMLMPIKSGIELLELTGEYNKNLIEMIKKGADNTYDLCETLTDIHKNEYDLYYLDMQECSLFQIFDNLNYDKRIFINYNGLENEKIICDKLKLIRCFNNIICNSLKYIKQDGYVNININKNPITHNLIIYCIDNGIEISAKKKNNIKKLLKVSKVSINLVKNLKLGLGLYVVKMIINNHKGIISLVEKENFVGTVIKIELPTSYDQSNLEDSEKY
jgi:K+-sensing histidine kinase KdpD